jgi:hypothetical protein
MGPWDGANTLMAVGVCYPSRFHFPDIRRYPRLGSELHSLQMPDGELFFVNIMEGTLGDISKFLIDMGLRVYTLRVLENVYLKGMKDPENPLVKISFGPSKEGPWNYLTSFPY